MDIAIVTGAETPLGLRIIQGLIQQGCRVHGIGNNLSKVTYADRNFFAHAIDVSDLSALQTVTSEILENEGALHILIHAIDVTPGAGFDKLPVGNLEAILKIGLLGPVILTRLALPNLLRFRGQLINVIPSNKSGHPASAVNALIEGGLREMNTALFDQARDAGVKVTNLVLKQNPELPRGTVSDEQLDQTRIDLDQVARTIDYLLNANESNVPNEITLHPRLSAQAEAALPEGSLPVDPYDAIVLPPAEYCPPEEPKITTKQPDRIDRTIPYTDEEMEEKIAAAIEDFEVHPERYEPKPKTQRTKNKKRENKETDNQQHENKTQTEDDEPNNSKRRRGRRRGGRNRNRNRDDKETQTQQIDKAEKPLIESKSVIVDESEQFLTKKPSNRRRRGPRKPDAKKEDKSPLPTKEVQKEQNQIDPEKAKKKPEPTSKPKVEKIEEPKTTSKKVAKKKTTKKTAKKVPTKKAAKKTVTKKAAKKSPTKKAAKKVVKKAAKKKTAKKAE